MINKIITYGDSFVMGGGLTPYNVVYPNSWPQLLGKKLGIDAINRGVGGGSNKLSIIKLLEDIEDIKTGETLVIFSWTSPSRTTFYDQDFSAWPNYLPNHEPIGVSHKHRHKLFYQFFNTDHDSLTNLYMQQLFLPAFLDSVNAPNFFINSFNDPLVNTNNLNKSLLNLSNSVDKQRYILGYDNSIQNEICNNLGKICQDNFHPSEEGHDILATMIAEYIKRKMI